MGTLRRIAKNASFLSAEILLINLLSFGLVVYVTRRLGAVDFGKYAFAKALLEILIVWADLGLTKLLIRDVARDPEGLPGLVSDYFAIKLVYTVVTFGLIVCITYLLGYSLEVRRIVFILGGAYLIHSFSGLTVSVFQGFERMEYGSLLSILRSVLLVVLGVLALVSGYGVVGLCLSVLISNVIHFVLTLYLLLNRFSIRFRPIQLGRWRRIVREGCSFGVGSVFVRIFARVDSVMLSKMIGMAVVGYYNAAYNIVLVLMFLPGVLSQALFPITSRYFDTDRKRMKRVFERSYKYSVLIGFPMATGMAVLADQIIDTLYGGGYVASAAALKVLSWTLALSFATAMFGNLLNSADRQLCTTYNMIVCAVANVVMNLVLIPHYGLIGASVATVLTEVILVSLSYKAVRKYIYVPQISPPLIRAALGCSLMGIAVYCVRDYSLFLSIPLGVAIYAVVLLLLRTFDGEDWYILKQVLSVRPLHPVHGESR
jgi:O-antigen/teichoic acid export membrane protein